MFNNEEALVFKNYCQSIVAHPRAIDAQPCIRDNGCVFLDDWEIIEILKLFFNRELYKDDPPPNRLKNNPLWKGKGDIEAKAAQIIEEFKTVDNIILYFEKRRGTK